MPGQHAAELGVQLRTYRVTGDGHVYATFEDSNGNVVDRWPGTNNTPADICQGKPTLRLHKGRSDFEYMAQALLTGGLAGKRLHIWYEFTQGACYIKSVQVAF